MDEKNLVSEIINYNLFKNDLENKVANKIISKYNEECYLIKGSILMNLLINIIIIKMLKIFLFLYQQQIENF